MTPFRWHTWLPLVATLVTACGGDSLCSNGGCAAPKDTEAGVTVTEVNTATLDAGNTATEATSAPSSSGPSLIEAGTDGTESSGGTSSAPSSDASQLFDASSDGGFGGGASSAGGAPHDAGFSADASLDASVDASSALDASDAATEAGPKPEELCAECECIDNFDCMWQTPICSLDNTCIVCDDTNDVGCPEETPWCKAGLTLKENTCIECRVHSDCDDEAAPACESDKCVTCSTLDNNGCGAEAPLCVAGTEGAAPGAPDAGNHCVQCVSSDDCGGDTPICEDSVCIPCSTRETEAGPDSGCLEQSATRCLAGAVPTENSCVECLENPDCSSTLTRLLCTDENACVECLANDHCTNDAIPRCDLTGTCSGCESDGDCTRFTNAPECDVGSGACVQCTSDDHCPSATAAACGEDFTCGACTSNSDCDHLDGLGVCSAGQCVQCSVQDETPCGLNSCNPATKTCTATPRHTVDVCLSCAADSECLNENLRCVPVNFQGAFHGNYCLRRQSATCSKPYVSEVVGQSLSGASSESYCGIPQDLTTCEAVLDLGQDCTSDSSCGDGVGGLCRTVETIPTQCTYPCNTSSNCPGSLVCSAPGGDGVPHCH